jgi:hypothetical protein
MAKGEPWVGHPVPPSPWRGCFPHLRIEMWGTRHRYPCLSREGRAVWVRLVVGGPSTAALRAFAQDDGKCRGKCKDSRAKARRGWVVVNRGLKPAATPSRFHPRPHPGGHPPFPFPPVSPPPSPVSIPATIPASNPATIAASNPATIPARHHRPQVSCIGGQERAVRDFRAEVTRIQARLAGSRSIL